MGHLDINVGKLKKNAFRYSKVRGETASRVRIPGGVIDAESLAKVVEIAGKYGYENGSKFAGAFRSVMGTSPSEYRRRIIWEKENNAASGMHNREDAEKN